MSALLAGKRILIVEDEPMIAMLLEDMILDEGGVVVGPAGRLVEALGLARAEGIDAAVLDVNLEGARSFAVADVLRERGIPFMFATGYGAMATTDAHADVPVIAKPYQLDALARGIAALMS